MATAREKRRAFRAKKRQLADTSEPLVQPVEMADPIKEKQKIRIATKSQSALVPGAGQSMGMDVD
jgi:large subunit ribosomal protein L24e